MGDTVESPLTRSLASAKARASPRQALSIGKRKFAAGERIEMSEVARELGISRATLFRWVGTRDQFLAEVVWSLGSPVMFRLLDEAEGRGAERVANGVKGIIEGMLTTEAFLAFVRREPENVLRILTSGASVVQQRLIRKVEEILREEIERGSLDPQLPVPDLAYVVVRIGEAFAYNDTITGVEPSPEKAARLIVAILR